MKIRVMSDDGTIEDFKHDEMPQAMLAFKKKKEKVKKAKVVDDIKPECNIHWCYNDEWPPRKCEIIERFEK